MAIDSPSRDVHVRAIAAHELPAWLAMSGPVGGTTWHMWHHRLPL